MTEAATCPFCGLRAWSDRIFDGPPSYRVHKSQKTGQERRVLDYGKHLGYKVECSICNARIERYATGAKKLAQAKLDALEAWALRTSLEADAPFSSYQLLPCPCCGGPAEVTFTDNTKRQPDDRFGRVNKVSCSDCRLEIIGLQLKHAEKHIDYVRVDAVSAWNKRSL
jgi:hypothetical protein